MVDKFLRKKLHKPLPSSLLVQLRMCTWHGAISLWQWWRHWVEWVVGPWWDVVTGLRYGSERWWRHCVAGSMARCGTVRHGSIDQSDLRISAGAHIGPIRWCYWVVGTRRDAVRYGTEVSTNQISAGAHIGPIRWWFFFSVVKFDISIGLFSTRHPFNVVLEWMIIPHKHTSQTDTVTLFWKEGGIHCNPPHYSW